VSSRDLQRDNHQKEDVNNQQMHSKIVLQWLQNKVKIKRIFKAIKEKDMEKYPNIFKNSIKKKKKRKNKKKWMPKWQNAHQEQEKWKMVNVLQC